jgi:hypothetical protein
MSPHLYRRLMREKQARLRRLGESLSRAHGAHSVSPLALNSTPAVRPRCVR